jgi:hypothetical protein
MSFARMTCDPVTGGLFMIACRRIADEMLYMIHPALR